MLPVCGSPFKRSAFFKVFLVLICLSFVFPQILEEADLDDDDSLSFAEFEHVISKAPDFVR